MIRPNCGSRAGLWKMSTYLGLHADVAAAPAIVLAAVTCFAIAFLVSPRGLRLRRRGAGG